MFFWSFHAHPTPSHPLKLRYKYIPLLLRYAPIIVEFGLCCYHADYMPSIHFLGMERKLSKEDSDIFYMEIEERIMRVISDDDEEKELKRKNGAPSLFFNGETPQLFPMSNSFVDVSRYGSIDMGMRQWRAPFCCGNCQKSSWAAYEMNKVRRSILARRSKGTGVFIPRYISA